MSKVRIYRRKGESPNWQAQVYVGGKRYRFSCHTRDKSTARRYGEQRAAALVKRNNRGLVGLPEPVQMSKVFERYEREYAPRLRPHARRRSLGRSSTKTTAPHPTQPGYTAFSKRLPWSSRLRDSAQPESAGDSFQPFHVAME